MTENSFEMALMKQPIFEKAMFLDFKSVQGLRISKSLCVKEETIPRFVNIFSMHKCKRYLRTAQINSDLASIMLVDKLR